MTEDLNRELAEAMGWTVNDSLAVLRRHFPDGGFTILPNFTTSLDALRDGPEKVLRESSARFVPRVEVWRDLNNEERWEFRWIATRSAVDGFPPTGVGEGTTEAEARARAALAALRALNGGS